MKTSTNRRTLRAASPPRGTARLAVAAACVGALVLACDVHTPTAPGTLASIVVTPNVTLSINATQQFIAVGKDAEGRAVAMSPTWSIEQGGGAISTSGLFTAGTTPGAFTSTVKASSGGISGTASVTVISGTLATLTVTPNPDSLLINGTQQFVAVGKDAGGNVLAVTPVWSVVAGGGSIASAGMFTAGTVPGSFLNTVQATSGSISGNATVVVGVGTLATMTVSPNPMTLSITGTQQYTAVSKDAGGNVLAVTPTWSVVAGGGAISGTGLFTAGVVPGTFANTVKASSGSISGTATVTVNAGPLATITVAPNPMSVPVNGTQQYSAVGKDASNNVVPVTPAWSVVAGGGAINGSGLFTAGLVLGTFTNSVKATSGAISGTATVTVITGPLASIVVTPDPATLASAATQQFAAAGKDAGNNPVVITPVWSVVAGGGAINGTGLFTAGGVDGTFTNTVRATSGAIFGNATVIVSTATPLINFGPAAPNGIMAGSTITCITGGTINAEIALHPGSAVTGYPPCVITGVQHIADGVALTAQNALTAAYDSLALLPCPGGNAIVADLGSTTKPAGVYCTAIGINVTGTLTLDGGGDPNANFVFQAGSTLTTAGDIVLIGMAQAKNVYWLVGSSATLGTNSQWQGNIVALTDINLNSGANLIGRALARNGQVALTTNNNIILP